MVACRQGMCLAPRVRACGRHQIVLPLRSLSACLKQGVSSSESAFRQLRKSAVSVPALHVLPLHLCCQADAGPAVTLRYNVHMPLMRLRRWDTVPMPGVSRLTHVVPGRAATQPMWSACTGARPSTSTAVRVHLHDAVICQLCSHATAPKMQVALRLYSSFLKCFPFITIAV